MLVDVAQLVTAYFEERPDPSASADRVAFGTSGHRGSSARRTFNEAHILAVTQAICEFRTTNGIDGPLFLGADTHALSRPALATALEVLAANDVDVMLDRDGAYTPTPAVSHAILVHNAMGRAHHAADGIVLSPSHNPPDDGGIKYNPPNGGPADSDVTRWIEARANELLESGCAAIKRIGFAAARRAASTHAHDYLQSYVSDLGAILDMDAIRGSRIRMGVDPLGGAGVHYWPRIAEVFKLDLTVVNGEIDPAFR
ncbi:MAG: alpha-D-glucose phosphate-specific phosphoglucomutase, partial [Candidatus Dormibacteria bacterium]